MLATVRLSLTTRCGLLLMLLVRLLSAGKSVYLTGAIKKGSDGGAKNGKRIGAKALV